MERKMLPSGTLATAIVSSKNSTIKPNTAKLVTKKIATIKVRHNNSFMRASMRCTKESAK